MKLSQRLLTLASFVKKGAVVADIGADHGLLSIYLIEEGIAKKVFAVENKKGPFSILEKSTKKYPEITCSFSDGISRIPDDVDTVVIAGMGGILISDILFKNKEKLKNVKYVIVDAHRDLELVRKTLNNLGYQFDWEKIVYEDVYYNVIATSKGPHKLLDEEVEFGYNIKSDPLFSEYKDHLLKQYSKVYAKNNSSELSQKIERLKRL